MRHFLLLLLFFVDISPVSSQATPSVDFTHLEGEITIVPERKEVSGVLRYSLNVIQPVDSVFLDAHDMRVSRITLNGEVVPFSNSGQRLGIGSTFTESTPYQLEIVYKANPKQTMYFWGWETDSSETVDLNMNLPESRSPQVWTQGQGKYTSHWLPSFDNTSEKVEFDLTYIFPKGYSVIANGELEEQRPIGDSLMAWKYGMQQPMSSYLLAVAAGDYEWKELRTQENIPVYLYYYPQDKDLVEPTYRHTLEIFEFLEQEIGVPYPWQNYKQIPVHNFLHSGMENTGTTIFSDFFMTDSIGYKDRNYVMVNAHEMAHQWFGNMVTAKSDEDHWLQEGFSTYYALLAEREIFGHDYYYWKLYEWAEQLQERSNRGEGEAVMRSGGSSLTYYYNGAWVLHKLREELGEQAFRSGIKRFLLKYQFSNASTQDFLQEMEAVSGMELTDFSKRWLRQSAFPAEEALESLRKSDFINQYLRVSALKEVPLDQKKEQLSLALGFPVNDYIGQQVVHQLALEDPLNAFELYKKAFETNNHFVRQSIATSLYEVPLALKSNYESLLEDDSYLTREAAFYNLWMNFPSDRSLYLQRLKNQEGFYDKNIEILWLALNLATPEFEPETQQAVFEELTGYTNPGYSFYVRRNAFQYLFQLNAFGPESILHLLEGTEHPVWRFRSFSRQLTEELIRSGEYQEVFEQLIPYLPKGQQAYLEGKISG